MVSKYRITKRGSVLRGQGIDGRYVDEKFIRRIVGDKNLDKVISEINSGKVVKTKNWIIRLAEDFKEAILTPKEKYEKN